MDGRTMRVEVLSGPRADRVARLLRAHDGLGLVKVEVVDWSGQAALVVSADADSGSAVPDVVLNGAAPLGAQVERLWADRIGPLARRIAGFEALPSTPSMLAAHDPEHARAAARLLTRLRGALTRNGADDGSWTYDHIGSTAVPDLRAKPTVDLQVGVDALPDRGGTVDTTLATLGFLASDGARPGSPGVHPDQVEDPHLAPAASHVERLYVRPDPLHPAILHARPLGDPWWSATVRFRDWLRADPAGRRAYERAKTGAAAARAGDAGYDHHSREKAAFFDRVRDAYESRLRVRRVEPGEEDAIAPLFAAYRMFYAEPDDPRTAAAFLRERLERAESVVLAAEDATGVVGFVQMYPTFSSVAARPVWVLNDLYVAEPARGRGVGELLMRHAENAARAAGAASVGLETGVDNEVAQRLYRRLGYRVEDEVVHLRKDLA